MPGHHLGGATKYFGGEEVKRSQVITRAGGAISVMPGHHQGGDGCYSNQPLKDYSEQLNPCNEVLAYMTCIYIVTQKVDCCKLNFVTVDASAC